MFALQQQDTSEVLCNRLEANRNIEVNNRNSRKPNLFRAIAKTFGRDLALAGIVGFCEEAVRMLMPVLIAALVRYFEDNDSTPVWYAYGYAAAICAASSFLVISHHQWFFWVQRIGWHIRASVCALMYKKTLRLSQKSLNQTTTGQIVTFGSTDVIRYDLLPMFLHYLWIAPLECVVATIMLWQEVGVAILAGMGILFVTMVMQGLNGKAFGKLRAMTAVLTDNRIRFMNEVFSGIRIIKMYAWENLFFMLVSEAGRTNWSLVLPKSSVFFVAGISSVLRLSVGELFVLTVEHLALSIASTKRIEAYLLLDEFVSNQSKSGKTPDSGTPYVEFKNFSGKWLTDVKNQNKNVITLQNISIRVEAGELLAVVGKVGAGKSSLLNAILGELPSLSGSIEISGNYVYASQVPWVFSGTIRENILFGEPYDQERYTKVVSPCSLTSDLKLFPDGDMTLVGERGVTLSGGQKARVNLARIAYKKDANICLLDDPFSAVDATVASHIYRHCISGIMGDRVSAIVTLVPNDYFCIIPCLLRIKCNCSRP